MPFRACAHPDVEVLEERLAATLEALRASPAAPLWLVTPTARLRRHVQERLARRGSWLGIDCLDGNGFATRLHETLGLPPMPPAGAATSLALLREALGAEPAGERLLAFAGAAESLVQGVSRLREVGGHDAWSPELEEALPPASGLLVRTTSRWRAALRRRELHDKFDAFEAAAQQLASSDVEIPAVVLFGFSEIVPRWLPLLRALGARGEVHLLALARGADAIDGFEAAERSFERLDLVPERLAGTPAAPPERVRFSSARGPAQEVDVALRTVSAWHRGGLPLERCAVVARGLEPYLPYLAPVAHELGLTESGEPDAIPLLDVAGHVPLARFAFCRAALDSGTLDPASDPRANVADGLWNSAPPAAREAWRTAWEDAAVASAIDGEPFEQHLRAAVRLAAVPPLRRGDGSGLAVLDFQQARGLRFDAVVFLGLHQGGCPRPVREDPFLPERARAALAPHLRAPLAGLAEERADELAMLRLALRTARQEVVVLRQHADPEGARVARSPAEDTVRTWLASDAPWRSVPSDPLWRAADAVAADAAAPEDAVLSVSVHRPAPGAAEQLVRAPAGAALLGPAAPWLAAVEDPHGEDLRFDGLVPEAAATAHLELRATSLEAYGRRPMAWFFERALGVEALHGERLPGPEPRELGTAMHLALEAWNRAAGPASSPERVDAALASFEEHVAPLFSSPDATLAPFLAFECERWRDALQRFLAWDGERLANGVSRGMFKADPLDVDDALVEASVDGELDLAGQKVVIRGKVDRVLRNAAERRVCDYKTGKVDQVASPGELLTGQRLQLALYLLLLDTRDGAEESRGSAEAVRIAPDCDYTRAPSKGTTYGSVLDAAKWESIRAGVVETAGVLLANLRAGHFPAKRNDHREPWDRWFATMRLGHAATLERIRGAEPFADLYALSRKNPGKKDGRDARLTLADVAALDQEAEA